jgi:hypothetical protein
MMSVEAGCVWTEAMLVLVEVFVRYCSCCASRGHAHNECTRCSVINVSEGLVLEYELCVLAVVSVSGAVVVDVEQRVLLDVSCVGVTGGV